MIKYYQILSNTIKDELNFMFIMYIYLKASTSCTFSDCLNWGAGGMILYLEESMEELLEYHVFLHPLALLRHHECLKKLFMDLSSRVSSLWINDSLLRMYVYTVFSICHKEHTWTIITQYWMVCSYKWLVEAGGCGVVLGI